MPENREPAHGRHFIPMELRPTVGPGLEKFQPLAPGASKAEIHQRAAEALDEDERERLGLEEGLFSSEIWDAVFARSAEVSWRVLDGEAVLLCLRSFVYYSLNPLGTVVWELLTGNRSLDELLAAIRAQFDVTDELARRDLTALISRLQREGLIEERR